MWLSFYIHHVGRFWKLLIDPAITQDACNTEPSECMTQLAVSLSVAQYYTVVKASDRAPKVMGSILVRDSVVFSFPHAHDMVGRGGVVVGALGLRSKGRWLEAQSLPSCYFFRQETLPHIVSLHPGV